MIDGSKRKFMQVKDVRSFLDSVLAEDIHTKRVDSLANALGIYQFRSTPQSCGSGRQDCINLTMRRSPRVNQEVLLRATFFG